MNENVLLWILGLQAAVIIGLGKALFDHVKECKDARLEIATIRAIAESIKKEIGDHDSGLRKQIHDFRKVVVKLAGKVPDGLEAFD